MIGRHDDAVPQMPLTQGHTRACPCCTQQPHLLVHILACLVLGSSAPVWCRLLMQTLLPYLKKLAEQPDVRQPLTADFKMAEYFRQQGYLLYEDPSSGFLTAAASVIS